VITREDLETMTSRPSELCRRLRLWKISRHSKIAFASSTRVFHRRRFSKLDRRRVRFQEATQPVGLGNDDRS
jgi:hypothetical protein